MADATSRELAIHALETWGDLEITLRSSQEQTPALALGFKNLPGHQFPRVCASFGLVEPGEGFRLTGKKILDPPFSASARRRLGMILPVDEATAASVFYFPSSSDENPESTRGGRWQMWSRDRVTSHDPGVQERVFADTEWHTFVKRVIKTWVSSSPPYHSPPIFFEGEDGELRVTDLRQNPKEFPDRFIAIGNGAVSAALKPYLVREADERPIPWPLQDMFALVADRLELDIK